MAKTSAGVRELKSGILDLRSIKPTVVSRDLTGKSFMFYGVNKTGKTTVASQFPKPIILGFEKGTNLIAGVVSPAIYKWTQALGYLSQLLEMSQEYQSGQTDEMLFKTVVIDTLDMACDMLEEYVCQQHGWDDIDSPGFGTGYKAMAKEIDRFNQEILKAGYTLVILGHSKTKEETIKELNADGKVEKTSITKIVPVVPPAVVRKCGDLVDVCGYTQPQGKNGSVLIARDPSDTITCGARGTFPSQIPFTYAALKDAMSKVVDDIIADKGSAAVTDEPVNAFDGAVVNVSYTDAVARVRDHSEKLRNAGKGTQVQQVIEKYLGRGADVMKCTEAQTDILEIIGNDLEDLVAEIADEEPAKKVTQNDFEKLQDQVRKYAEAFSAAKMMEHYREVVARHLGAGKLVQDCGISQAGAIKQILVDLGTQAEAFGVLVA